ncbi:cadmium-translocating P-type ATPase [Heliobacterium chlorum]|uniref:Cd(2+)-exporting ATPase n=1 Tax=Heliobacterium chlorum TaxID=2698 RepID=A0ABR7T7M8_HELCL|nr:heavy metal translocating P-type ATPase [Heliobacterium chlorum]MBC9785696.1 cadmium-translocating P-type ATPase [Heliobacterium chlorum]
MSERLEFCSDTTLFQIDGICCLDCAAKFEKSVASLPGVIKSTLNPMTGKLTVVGNVDLPAIRRLGKEENYRVHPIEKPAAASKTVLSVDGICCLDCASKFERRVASLPGITSASLNTMTGKMTLDGTIDIEAIQQLGRAENYQIHIVSGPALIGADAQGPLQGGLPIESSTGETLQKKPVPWERVRMAASGVALVMAYISETLTMPFSLFISLYLTATLLGGWGNFRKAAFALPRGKFNSSVLMSVAVLGAIAIGKWEEAASVAFLFSVSEMLEFWTMDRARHSIRQLMDIAPKKARIRRGDDEVEIPVEEILIGDIMIIRPGEKIAMDGLILTGESAVNQAAITGESVPLEKGPGESVFAGTLNTYGYLEVSVTTRVEDTTIAKIIHMVEEAQGKRAPSQAFIERFAAVYTPIVMVLAASIALLPPLFLGFDWGPWIYRGLALLVISCPCALVVSTPVAMVSAISTAAKKGVLIKGGLHLEEAGSLAAIAFDKTGTLTQGVPSVTDIIAFGNTTPLELLEIAASLEDRSEHPLAKAIVAAAKQQGLAIHPVEQFRALPGRGAQGAIKGQMVFIGNVRLFTELGIQTEPVTKSVTRLQGDGKTAMIVGTETSFLGVIAVADELRETSASSIRALKDAGLGKTIMLTGDNELTANAIAAQVGVDDYHADLLPQDKVKAMEELLNKYGKVAMVGDGINDAPALALSTVGIAMGGAGTDTAMETADIVLMADDLSKLPFTIRLSRDAMGIIRQNIAFALGLKALALLAVFPGWLTLWLAIFADMGASILVTLNSLRLLKTRS